LVSMGKNRPHPFAAIFRKGCGLFFMKKMRFREQSAVRNFQSFFPLQELDENATFMQEILKNMLIFT
jgi:lauroyl/myristoyl acyltransferase